MSPSLAVLWLSPRLSLLLCSFIIPLECLLGTSSHPDRGFSCGPTCFAGWTLFCFSAPMCFLFFLLFNSSRSRGSSRTALAWDEEEEEEADERKWDATG